MTVRKVVEDLVYQNNYIIMLMHSYGGFVGSEAVKGLDI